MGRGIGVRTRIVTSLGQESAFFWAKSQQARSAKVLE